MMKKYSVEYPYQFRDLEGREISHSQRILFLAFSIYSYVN